MVRPLFTLGKRLALCASMVREGTALADIGTDHAYLPVWLAREGKISRAVAADIKLGPLRAAQRNIKKYDVEDRVSARLSNGLETVFPNEADDIVIAGMGGELIASIIDDASWLKDSGKRLILQPMTSPEELRLYLASHGFSVLRETAVAEDGHLYSVMLVQYHPGETAFGELYPYAGKIIPCEQDGKAYILHRAEGLQKKSGRPGCCGEKRRIEALCTAGGTAEGIGQWMREE